MEDIDYLEDEMNEWKTRALEAEAEIERLLQRIDVLEEAYDRLLTELPSMSVDYRR